MKAEHITQEQLKAVLHYDPGTGNFTWLHNKKRNPHAGETAGRNKGARKGWYRDITIDHKTYAAHRLAWLYVHGWLPDFIDHINRSPADNRIANLRPASKAQNGMNRSASKSNKTGYKGVVFRKSTGRFIAAAKINGKSRHIGCFDTAYEAHLAYENAVREFHGEFYCATIKVKSTGEDV